MKLPLIALALAALSLSAHADLDGEGDFSNGNVTIGKAYGARGAMEFTSSKCAGKSFYPKWHEASNSYSGADFKITEDAKSTRLEVTAPGACFPKGTYKRVS